jgi:hypothetical protein
MPTKHSPAENSKKLPRGKPFQPGKTGNPGGRPRKTEEERTLEEMCKEKTPEALATILSIMDSGEQERARLSAAQYVIDRGWGKAKESIALSGGLTLSIAEQIKQAHEQRKSG